MKINLEVKHEGETYLLRIKKSVYKGVEMYYENIISGNWLFKTWRNGETLQDVAKKWDELFELNNVKINRCVEDSEGFNVFNLIPINDLEEHQEDLKCKCEPKLIVENEGNIIVHNSFDRRELIEQVIDIMNEDEFGYCKHEIEGNRKCTIQCDHCKMYYKPLEDNL